MTPVDQNITYRKLESLLENRKHLEVYLKCEKPDSLQTLGLLRALQNSLTSVIDISKHIVSEELSKVPDSYYDAIKLLGQTLYLDETFASNFASAAGLRNILVHSYEEVNLQKIQQDLPKIIKDLGFFADEISRGLKIT